MDFNGRLWHPYKENLQGVFSNELMTQIIDDIKET